MIKISNFKEINRRYGRTAGDSGLHELAFLIKKNVRQSDLICRNGGDEFSIILPDTDLDNAGRWCNKFSEMVKHHRFRYKSSQFHLNIRMGLTSIGSSKAGTHLGLVEEARKQLQIAQKEGY